MNFELTPELTDQIIFGMENQNEFFYLNLQKGTVEAEKQVDPQSKTDETLYVLIPRWNSADGFHLMEKFVDSLRNPVYRERLRAALAGGKGVFRNFKNILKEREDIQRLWFQFKEREMRSRVREWHEELCEAWGFQQLGPEPEETEELVLSDFIIETAPDSLLGELEEWDFRAFEEACAGNPPDLTHLFYLARRSLTEGDGSKVVLRAATPAGETAGLIWGIDAWLSERVAAVFADSPGVSFLLQIYVTPEFRGLGLGRLLLETYIRNAYRREMKRVVMDLWGGKQSMGRILDEYGFRSCRSSFQLDLDEWGRGEGL
jgi:GNAT superfamily N-acetyltransferase